MKQTIIKQTLMEQTTRRKPFWPVTCLIISMVFYGVVTGCADPELDALQAWHDNLMRTEQPESNSYSGDLNNALAANNHTNNALPANYNPFSQQDTAAQIVDNDRDEGEADALESRTQTQDSNIDEFHAMHTASLHNQWSIKRFIWVGMIAQHHQNSQQVTRFAMLQLPSGKVIQVSVGNRLGREAALITSIDDAGLDLLIHDTSSRQQATTIQRLGN